MARRCAERCWPVKYMLLVYQDEKAMQDAARIARESRRVDESRLTPRPVEHAHDARSRRVRLGGDDAELLADESVQQGRLADVRPAEQRDVPCLEFLIRLHP